MARADLRAWKDEGRGFFCDHGKHFQMVNEPMPELLGHGNLIPFGHIPSKILKPKPVNYPIPAVGDHRLRWFNSFMLPENVKSECY